MKTLLRRYASIGGRKIGGLDHRPNELESRLNSTSWCSVNLSNLMATQGGYGMPEFAASQSAISTLTRVSTDLSFLVVASKNLASQFCLASHGSAHLHLLC